MVVASPCLTYRMLEKLLGMTSFNSQTSFISGTSTEINPYPANVENMVSS